MVFSFTFVLQFLPRPPFAFLLGGRRPQIGTPQPVQSPGSDTHKIPVVAVLDAVGFTCPARIRQSTRRNASPRSSCLSQSGCRNGRVCSSNTDAPVIFCAIIKSSFVVVGWSQAFAPRCMNNSPGCRTAAFCDSAPLAMSWATREV